MKLTAVLALLALPLLAEQPRPTIPWKLSLATLAAGFTADAATTTGRYEGNPILRGPNGGLGARGISIKLALIAPLVVTQLVWPRSRRPATMANFIVGGALSAVAARNSMVQSR